MIGSWAKIALLPSRAYYALDLLLGRLGGEACPNCGTAGTRNPERLRRHGGLERIRSCTACGLLYRPVGISSEKLLRLYYSHLYTDAGVATSTALWGDPVALERQIREEGKDRSAVVARLLGRRRPSRVCVLGCSWGYEMLPIRSLGVDVFGIELSKTRREYGKRELGLAIFSTPAEAAREGRDVDLLMSSHILEHVPHLTEMITKTYAALRPRIQLHVTPCVEAVGSDPASNSVIGRDHPIGVTRAFWNRLAAGLGLAVEFSVAGAVAGRSCGESIVVLRR